MKKALLLLGSPQPDGFTDRLGISFLSQLTSPAWQTKVIAVREYGIAPCTGCQKCSVEPHKCVLADTDAVEQIFLDMDSAHLLAVSTPVYFYGVPSHLKALIDRSQPLWFRSSININSRPLVILAAAGRTRGQHLFDGVTRPLELFGRPFRFILQEKVLQRGTDRPEASVYGEAAAIRVGMKWAHWA